MVGLCDNNCNVYVGVSAAAAARALVRDPSGAVPEFVNLCSNNDCVAERVRTRVRTVGSDLPATGMHSRAHRTPLTETQRHRHQFW